MTTSVLPPASHGTLEAAKAGAAGPHARINLKRMVVRLEARSRPHNDDDEGEERWEDLSLEKLRTDWQTVCYARALYEELESEGFVLASAVLTAGHLHHPLQLPRSSSIWIEWSRG